MPISQIIDPPLTTDSVATFRTKAFAAWAALVAYATQANALETNVNAKEVTASAAAASAVAAAANANALLGGVGASLWVSGTTYAINNKAISPANGRVYIRLTAGAGTTDPASDGANWSLFTQQFIDNYVIAGGTTFAAWNSYRVYMGSVAAPFSASMPSFANTRMGDEIKVSNMYAYWASYAFTITCPANVFFTRTDVAAGSQTDTSLVCRTNIGGFTLRCVYKDATNAYWNVLSS